jgi:hypothetical protein
MKRLFTTLNIRVGYMNDIKTDKPIAIAVKDVCYKDGEKWDIAHLTVEEIRELRDVLDTAIKEQED